MINGAFGRSCLPAVSGELAVRETHKQIVADGILFRVRNDQDPNKIGSDTVGPSE